MAASADKQTPATNSASEGALRELTREECLRLLASQHLGRLVVSTTGGPPVIRPVNYVFDTRSQSIVFRSAPGLKLQALRHAFDAAFEVDGIDARTQTGWSVIVRGVTDEITDQAEVRRLGNLGFEPWAPGSKPHWVRIRAWTVSGRQILARPATPPGNYLG